jgi:hypothetical protein
MGKGSLQKTIKMGSKPITFRSKSPLKAGDELLGKKTVVDADGNRLSADDSGERTPGTDAVPEVRKTVLYSDLPESQRAAAREYNMKKFGTHNPTAEGKANNTKVVQEAKPATEGSFNRATEYKPELTEGRDADKVDTFYPWEARFARRTQRASVRDEKRRGRRAERDLNKALNRGVISQDEYDSEIGNARRMRYGQGNIAQRQIGVDGGIEGTEGFDAITSQGYQANRRNSIRTDMNRRPQGEQKAGMPVKADGTEDMSQAEYEAGGKQTKVNVAPKTSPRIQAESKGAQTLAKVDMTKPESPSASASSVSEAQDFDLRSIDAKAPMGSEGPAKPQRKQSSEMFGEKPSGPLGGKGVESDDLSDLSASKSTVTDPFSQADQIFGDEGVVVRGSRGAVGGKGIESDPMAGVEAPTPTEPKRMNESYGIDINDAASEVLEEDLSASRSAFKMKYKHSSAMMYKGNSPAKMWGPAKSASAGKTTGAQNIDNSTPGRPVTQNVTRSAKGIATGKLSQSNGFKMKGFGNGKK